MSNMQYTIRNDRALIRVSGEDARPFLQGLISNDVEKVTPNRAIYAAFLTAQGKFLHEFFVSELNGALWLDCEANRRDDLVRRLTMYKLRSNAEVEIIDDHAVAVAFGPEVAAGLELTPEAGAAANWQGGVAYIDPRLASAGARLILPTERIASAFEEAGFERCPEDAYEALRLNLGLPDGSRDLEVEKAILLESGFDELNGVDWDKGCFLGQELTARTKYRGLVKKRLMPVTISGPVPSPGTPLMADGKDAGEMRSAQGDQGIALVRIEAFESGRPLTAGDSTVTPSKPSWLVFQGA